MSVLSAKIDSLRLMARLVREYDYAEISRMLREAADTIESLRDRAQTAIELERENERLRRAGYEVGYHDAMKAAHGECELVETESYSSAHEVIHVLECSECGETCEHVNGAYPRCPHCGRKVVKR